MDTRQKECWKHNWNHIGLLWCWNWETRGDIHQGKGNKNLSRTLLMYLTYSCFCLFLSLFFLLSLLRSIYRLGSSRSFRYLKIIRFYFISQWNLIVLIYQWVTGRNIELQRSTVMSMECMISRKHIYSSTSKALCSLPVLGLLKNSWPKRSVLCNKHS